MQYADVVLGLRDVHPCLSAIGGVDLRDERGRHLHGPHAALVDSGAQPGQVPYYAAPECDQDIRALHARASERAQHALCLRERLVPLPRRNCDHVIERDRREIRIQALAVERKHALVRDDERAPARGPERGGRVQGARAQIHRVAAGRRGGARPRHTHRWRRACIRKTERRLQRAFGLVSPATRNDSPERRLVERRALGVQALEARPVARERASRLARALPRQVQVCLQVQAQMLAQAGAHLLACDRAAAEGEHSCARAVEKLEHHRLLALAEGGLAITVEEARDRLSEPLLEQRVGVDHRRAQAPAGDHCGARLARAHETDQHHLRGRSGGRGGIVPAPHAHLFHSIRRL